MDVILRSKWARSWRTNSAVAREVTLAEADGRSYPAKLRDALARLFSPYL